MVKKAKGQNKNESAGISNRGKKVEAPAQQYVRESFAGGEITGEQDSILLPDMRDARVGHDVDIDGDNAAWLTPEQQSGGERHVDSRDGQADHSHH